MGATCSSCHASSLEAGNLESLSESDDFLEKARLFAEKKEYHHSIQFYNEALRLRVKYFGLDENSEASLRRRKSKVLERRLSAVKIAVVLMRSLRKTSHETTPRSRDVSCEQQDAAISEDRSSTMHNASNHHGHSARKYLSDDANAAKPRNALDWLKHKGAFQKLDKEKEATHLIGSKVVEGNETGDFNICEADLVNAVPYHFSHVQLLVEIGNLHLSFQRIHYAFFFFVQTLSIVAPIVRSMKPVEDLGSSLLLYVDAVLGLCIIYIKCAKAEVLAKLNATDLSEEQAVQELFQLPDKSVLPASWSTDQSDALLERSFPSRAVQIAAASGGLNATTLVRSSISKMIDSLEGSHPLDLAEIQADTAIKRVRDADGPRSSLLISLMHVKAQVQLLRGMKRQALQTVQKTLGMTYCRHGASDAMELSLYTHRILVFIKSEIAMEERLTADQSSTMPVDVVRGVSLVAERALAAHIADAADRSGGREDTSLQMLQSHLPPGAPSDFTEIRRVASMHFDRSEERKRDISAMLDHSATHDEDEDDCDLWFAGCKKFAAETPLKASSSGAFSSVSDFSNDDGLVRRIVSFLRRLGNTATTPCGATPSHSPAPVESADASDGRGLSFQSTSSAFAGAGPVPVPIPIPLPQLPHQPDDNSSCQAPAMIVESGPPHVLRTPPAKFSASPEIVEAKMELIEVSGRGLRGDSSNSLSNNITNSGIFPSTTNESPAAGSITGGSTSGRKLLAEDDVVATLC
jgi:hypothetical protein